MKCFSFNGKPFLPVLLCFSSLAGAAELTLDQLITVDRSLKKQSQTVNTQKKTEIDLVLNGQFKSGKDKWKFHECRMEKGHPLFANTTYVYSQLWQNRKITLKAGTAIRIELKAIVSDPDNLLRDQKRLAQYRVFFKDPFGKKTIFAKGEEGKAGRFKDTAGKVGTFTAVYKVPEGVGQIVPAICLNIPVRIEVLSFRVLAQFTRDEAEKNGIELSSVPTDRLKIKLPPPEKCQIPGKICRITYPVTIPMNGSAAAWKKIPYAGSCDYVIPGFSAPSGKKDSYARFKLAMDDVNCYIYVEITDDKLQCKDFADFNFDSAEIFFSPLFRRAARNDKTDFHITVAPEKKDLSSFSLSGDHYRNSFQPVVKGIPYPGGWAFELSFPLKNALFEISPYDGYIMGFNLQINDNDSGKRDHKISWSMDHGEKSWARPDVLGAAILRTDLQKPVCIARATPASTAAKREEAFCFVNKEPGSINLLRNGDFEHGETNWTDWYCVDGSFMAIGKEAARTGRQGAVIDARLLEKNALASALCSNSFQVIPGQKYRLSFYAKNESDMPVHVPVTYKSQDYIVTYIPMKCGLAPKEGWKYFQGDFVVPAKYDRENSVVQLMIRGNTGGARICFDDIKLVCFNPGKLDALLDFAADGFAFPKEKVPPARLILSNSGKTACNLVILSRFTDFLHPEMKAGKDVEQKITLAAGERKTVFIPVPDKKYGLFQIRTKVTNSKDNTAILRRTEYAVCNMPLKPAEIAGVCFGHHHLQPAAAVLSEAALRMGAHSVRVFVDRQQEYRPGKFDFRTLSILNKELRKRKMDMVACISVMSLTRGQPTDDISGYENYLRALVTHFKGGIPYYELGNEPNLWMGWPPKSSAEEYSMFMRAAYCTIRSIDPAAKIMNAGISQGALDEFTRKLLALNGGCYYDIFAFHPYDFLGTAGYRKGLEETINTVDAAREGMAIFDTESNLQSSDGAPSVERISKRIPVYHFLGIARHHNWNFDRMSSGHIYTYGSSPGAAYPAYCWQNVFYSGKIRSLGGLSGKGEFECYAVRKENGEKRAAVWRTYPGSKGVFAIPATPASRVYDAFGNDVTDQQKRKGGKLLLNPVKELPLFVTNCGDLAPLNLQLFRRTGKGRTTQNYSRDVLLLPRHLLGFFSQNMPGKSERTLQLYVKNYAEVPRKVNLKVCSQPTGMQGKLMPDVFTLAPGEIKPVTLKVKSPADGKYTLHCDGTADGLKLADVPVSFEVTDLIDAGISGRHLVISNNSAGDLAGKFSIVGKVLDVIPFQKSVTLPAGKKCRIQIEPTPRLTGLHMPSNGLFPVDIHLTAGGKNYAFRTAFAIAEARNLPSGSIEKPWYPEWGNCAKLKLVSSGKEAFSANLRFRRMGETLYIAGEVTDPSYAPDGKLGYLSGGDSVIVGIDPACNQASMTYGRNCFEAGFSPAGESYRWNGTYGLEAAKPFPEAKYKFFRTKQGYSFNLAIPMGKNAGKKGRIGFALRIINRTVEGKLEYLDFGSGIGKVKDGSAFGTLILAK